MGFTTKVKNLEHPWGVFLSFVVRCETKAFALNVAELKQLDNRSLLVGYHVFHNERSIEMARIGVSLSERWTENGKIMCSLHKCHFNVMSNEDFPLNFVHLMVLGLHSCEPCAVFTRQIKTRSKRSETCVIVGSLNVKKQKEYKKTRDE
jgi:hypothetical protein